MAKKPETAPQKPAQPEPRPRRMAMVALAAEVPALAKQALGSKGFAEAGLFTHWAEIAGAALAASSLPIKLAFPHGKKGGKREDGTLTVRCGGSAALELQHLAPSVLERINQHFGYPAVARLRIEQGAVGQRKATVAAPPLTSLEQGEIARAVESVADGEIRGTLARLGTAIRRREKTSQKR
ncbi:MAG TPA: DciA family protein [Alphaproteobacteria bacterium]|nr:DciA family protein [Alphaproteobacteria bacterium]